MYKRVLSVVSGFLISVSTALSLDGGFGYGFLQMTFLGDGEVAKGIENRGFPAPPSNCTDLGGSGYWIFGRFVAGIEGGSLCGTETSKRGSYESTYQGAYMTLNGGYSILKRKNSLVLIDGGLGYAAIDVNVKDSSKRAGEFFTHYIATTSGAVGRLSLTAVKRIGKGIFLLQGGLFQPITGLEIEGGRLGTTTFLRLGVGMGYWM